ncbi:hypothetical protein [Micromonospora sp. NPDC005173]|uniref:hypothetical protein n=1 Tax=Micromonospora sp. NPDC005173 TaxID=3157165 RepID=UPI0033B59A77
MLRIKYTSGRAPVLGFSRIRKNLRVGVELANPRSQQVLGCVMRERLGAVASVGHAVVEVVAARAATGTEPRVWAAVDRALQKAGVRIPAQRRCIASSEAHQRRVWGAAYVTGEHLWEPAPLSGTVSARHQWTVSNPRNSQPHAS